MCAPNVTCYWMLGVSLCSSQFNEFVCVDWNSCILAYMRIEKGEGEGEGESKPNIGVWKGITISKAELKKKSRKTWIGWNLYCYHYQLRYVAWEKALKDETRVS